jgi:acetylglutamate kinase
VADGTVNEGMIPKVRACTLAVRAGVTEAHILDGRAPHALLLEVFTDEGIGTMVTEHGTAGPETAPHGDTRATVTTNGRGA